MSRRTDRKPLRAGDSPAESFPLHRLARSRRARVLNWLLVLRGFPPGRPLLSSKASTSPTSAVLHGFLNAAGFPSRTRR